MLKKIITRIQKFSPGLRQVISNTSWLVGDQILRMGIGLVVGTLVTRYLGPEQFGVFSYAMTFVFLFSPIAQLGINSIVVRDLAANPLHRDETLGTSFVLRFLASLAMLILSTTAIYFIATQESRNTTILLVLIIAGASLIQTFDTIDFWFQSQVQSKYTTIARSSSYFIAAILRLILVQVKAPLIAFGWAIFIENTLATASLIIIYHQQGFKVTSWRFTPSLAKALLVESFPLLISGLTIHIYSKIDEFMLGTLLPNKTELGYYAAAVKLSSLFDFLPMTLNVSILPKLAAIKKKNQEEFLNKTQAYIDIMTFLWLGVAIPISLASPFLIHFLYGPSYQPTASILSIYIWAQFGTNFGVARSTYMVLEGRVGIKPLLTVIGAVLNICLNYYMIPKLGGYGATVATLITYFVTNVLLNFVVPDLKFIGVCMLRSLNLPQAGSRVLALLKPSE